MIRIPAFKSHFRVSVTLPDLVFFISETGYRVIQGRILCMIAPLINGIRSSREIANHFKGKLNRTDIECALLLFEAEGFLVDAKQNVNKAPRATGTPSFQIKRKANFAVVLVDDYLKEGLERFNRSAVKKKNRWVLLKPTGNVFWFGPVFSPPDGPCWNCLAIRLKEKRRVDAFLQANPSREIHSALSSIGEADKAALNLAMRQSLRAIESRTEPHEIVTFDVEEMKLERHAVIRRSECPECGTGPAEFPAKIKLRKNTGLNLGSGFDRLKHHISSRTGVIDEMKAVGNHPLIHSVVADHLFMPNLQKKDLLRKGLTQKSWGKGCTLDQAQTGAMYEALERYSGVFRGSEYRIEKSERELGDEALSLRDCLNFSDNQYSYREKWNKASEGHDWVPVPLNPSQKIEWTPVWSLTNQRFRYVPTAYCYYGYSTPPNRRFCRADSNGNAAGDTLEQAIFHGFLEVAERDCAAMWWFNRAVRPGVQIESFPVPYLHDLVSEYKTLHWKMWALDLTNDLGIPCFAALSEKKDGAGSSFLIGLGAHFNPITALIRAITEMNQFLAVRIATSRRAKDQTTGRSVTHAKYLRPDDAVPALEFDQYQNKAVDDASRNVKRCVQLAKTKGMETFVLDQTRTDIGLPVVKVIVPGMRQLWRRFAPGRLYDVPVRLGWLKKSLKENELNGDPFLI